jgi:flagellin
MTINNISGIIGNLLLNELSGTGKELMTVFERLSTGSRINNASDDAAGLAIATRLESQVRALGVAERNAQMGISMIQTAEGYLGSVTDDLQRMRELSVQAANGTLNDSDRAAIQEEINALRENIDYTFRSAEFNSKQIFSGQTQTYQVGTSESGTISVEYPAMSAESIGLGTVDVSTQEGAEAAISQVSSALDDVLEVRTGLGASQNALESSLDTISQARIDTLSSLSTIRDANMVEELINQSQLMTKLESQLMVASQINKLNRSIIPMLLGED